MKTYPAAYLSQLAQAVNTLAVCWQVIRRDGEEILGTEHTANIEIGTGFLGGTYLSRAGITGSDIRSTSDMSVENLEVVGKLISITTGDSSDTSLLTLLDLRASDIEAGLFDNAEVRIFLVNYEDPDAYQDIRRTGWLGNTTRTAEGQYKVELRGLTQALTQGIVRTYGTACDADFGDARCKIDLSLHQFDRSVTVVTDRRNFQIDSSIGITQIAGGKVTWLTGFNAGYQMEIKSYLALQMGLFLPMPNDITIGDTLRIQRGCDKLRDTCLNTYNNLNNFRGHGVFVPGDTEILKVGKAGG